MGAVGLWSTVVAGFILLYLSVFVELSVLMLQYRGQHVVDTNSTMIFSDSLATDVQSMQDVTSISTFAVETVRGLFTLLAMTSQAAVLLVAISASCPGPPLWDNLVGYTVVVLVGVFLTGVPGDPPRRDYNPLFLWTVDDAITEPIHIAAAAVFLFVPVIATIWREWKSVGWRDLYLIVFIVNVGYCGALIAATYDESALFDGVWVILEIGSFGFTFCVYSAYEICRLSSASRLTSTYSKLPFPPRKHGGRR